MAYNRRENIEVSEGIEVKGTREMMLQAEAGLKLLKSLEKKELEGDRAAAEAWKTAEDQKIRLLEEEAEALTGAENKKARQAKNKEIALLKRSDQFIDAELVLKGKPPKHGFFILPGQEEVNKANNRDYDFSPDAKAEPRPPVKDAGYPVKPAPKKEEKEKKAHKTESAGISKDERAELEKLKLDIIARKSELKGTGLSGSQINKDPQVVTWVTRMNELKEKENPGSTTAGKKEKDNKKDGPKLSGETAQQLEKLTHEIEEYRQRLISEFGYTKKDIAQDPDMIDMQAKLKKLQGKK